MASRMDYQLIQKKAKEYYLSLEEEFNKKISEDNIERIGFYFLVLSNITGVYEEQELIKMIIDKEFVSLKFGELNEDLGVDAVFIDEEEYKIHLFNFKYRNSFSKMTSMGSNEVLLSTKFLSYFGKENINIPEAKLTSKYLNEINNRLEDTKEDWEVLLHSVSNDGSKLDISHSDLQPFRSEYRNLKLDVIDLNTLSDFFSIKPKKNNATLVLSKEDFLIYEESANTTSKSYIVKLPLIELIKITSDDIELRKVPKIEKIEEFSCVNIDRGVLFDNVRGYLGETDYNNNILATLKDEPEKFFLYNNGITITAKQIEVNENSLTNRYKVELTEYQIVNGGQTLRTIFEFKNKNRDVIENLGKSNVLVRLFKAGNDELLINKIAEYTNSQNAISGTDLKSVDSIQIELERNLKAHRVLYKRKNEIDSINSPTDFDYTISMIKLGQLLLSYYGYPEKASNQKKKIFGDYYNKLFSPKPELLDICIKLIKTYDEIDQEYRKTDFELYDQKSFHIVFLLNYFTKISDSIEFLEKNILAFRKDEDVPMSRKLIQTKFKEQILKELEKQFEKIDVYQYLLKLK